MTLRHRRKRPLERDDSTFRDARLIIIATEGRKTESQYFGLFGDTRVQVKVLPTGADNRSSPENVLGRLKEFRDEYEIGDFDELWLAIDVDRWPPHALARVAQECGRCRFGCAISNPCFEVWLLCHFEDPGVGRSCKQLGAQLRNALGGKYNKSKIDGAAFQVRINDAVRRASLLDPSPSELWPIKTGTHVYKLIRSIFGLTDFINVPE